MLFSPKVVVHRLAGASPQKRDQRIVYPRAGKPWERHWLTVGSAVGDLGTSKLGAYICFQPVRGVSCARGSAHASAEVTLFTQSAYYFKYMADWGPQEDGSATSGATSES